MSDFIIRPMAYVKCASGYITWSDCEAHRAKTFAVYVVRGGVKELYPLWDGVRFTSFFDAQEEAEAAVAVERILHG